jgi:hypothetical protein
MRAGVAPVLASLLLTGCGLSSPAAPDARADGPAGQATDSPQPPAVCATRDDLAAHWGQTVVLAGTYRKQESLKRMPRPGEEPELVFLGYVSLELSDGTRVALGRTPRPADEIEAFADREVRVRGRLDPDPDAGSPEVRPAPVPTLMDPAEVALAGS